MEAASAETNVEPTEAQKKAGNYKKGHLKIDGFDVSIEQPKGSVRRGTDASGMKWEQTMNNTYGYLRGTEGVDGDHIDVFLSDDPSQGDVFVVDQVNRDGTFDEHKVMYGFADEESARQAYLANYEEGWTGLGAITHVSKDEFKKWVKSSHRKTKPFAEYKGVQTKQDKSGNGQVKVEKVAETLKKIRAEYPDRVLGEHHKDGSVTYHDEDALLVSDLLDRKLDGESITLSKKDADRALQLLIANGHKVAFYGDEYAPLSDNQGGVKTSQESDMGTAQSLREQWDQILPSLQNAMRAFMEEGKSEDEKVRGLRDVVHSIDDGMLERVACSFISTSKKYGKSNSQPWMEKALECLRMALKDRGVDVVVGTKGLSTSDRVYTSDSFIGQVKEAGKSVVKVEYLKRLVDGDNYDYTGMLKDYPRTSIAGYYRIGKQDGDKTSRPQKSDMVLSYERKGWDASSPLEEMKDRAETLEAMTATEAFSRAFPEIKAMHEEANALMQKYGGRNNIPKAEEDALQEKYKEAIDRSRQLHEEISELRQLIAEREADEALLASVAQKKEAAKELETAYNGFLANMTPLSRSRTDKALKKQVNFGAQDGGVMSVAGFVERQHRAGSLKAEKASELPVPNRTRWNRMTREEQLQWEQEHNTPRTKYYVNGFELGKTAYDYAVYLDSRGPAAAGGARRQKGALSAVSSREAALRDAMIGKAREAGIEVVTDVADGQRVLDAANVGVRMQAELGGLKKASDFILSFLQGKTNQRSAKLRIPERANRLAEKAIGHEIKSHTIHANELTHAKNRHGISGTANTENSIPLRDEDFALMPYIMSAPTRVVKGSMSANGTESVRYEKDLSNGVVVVVEREGRFDVSDMENITMWAQKKPATNVTVAQKASHSTSETIVISEADAAKIRKDAEDAIRAEEKNRLQKGTLSAGNRQEVNVPTTGRTRLQKAAQTPEAERSKEQQLQIINSTNPAPDSYHTWVRTTDDILTLDEAVRSREEDGELLSSYPDVSDDVIRKALSSGKIKVYSSQPIQNGTFVSPSLMMARDYAGRNNVFSADVSTSDVAWIDTDEGMLACTSGKEPAGGGRSIRFFRTKDGHAYGFVNDGKIYIDPRIASAETPIHEYSHLWSEAFRQKNPDEWKNVVELMKGTSVWDEVKKLYPELKTDDDIAEEVLSQYSGRRGAERLRAEQERVMGSSADPIDKAHALTAIERVRDALKKFWKGVADWLNIHFTTAEEVADRVLADMLGGLNPTKTARTEGQRLRMEQNGEEAQIVARAKADGTYMKALNGKPSRLSPRQWVQVRTRAFKEWFGDWELGQKVLNIVSASREHGFKNFADARVWAKENIVRTLTNAETGGKGEIRISNNAVEKFLSESAVKKSESKDVHLSVLKVLHDVIRESVDAELHPDYKKGADGKRSAENGTNENVTIHRLYGAVEMGGNTYRVKVTLKEYADSNRPQKAYSYEATKIELLAGTLVGGKSSNPSTNNSITAANLLKGVEKSDGSGKKLLDCSKVVDENGEPLVVYHGSGNRRIRKFNSENGITWVSSMKGYAEAAFGKGGRTYSLLANIRNPLYVGNVGTDLNVGRFCEATGLPYEGVVRIAKGLGAKWVYELTNSNELRQLAIQHGYDGLEAIEAGGRAYAAFTPMQVKSATGNIGTFDVGNPDIRYHFIGEKGASSMDKYEDASIRIDNLAVAREMEAAGKEANVIKLATGWERGADGKWRYEIEDGRFDITGELHPERRRLSDSEKKELDDAFEETMKAFEKGSIAYEEEITVHTDMADIYEAGGMERKKAERIAYLEDKENRLMNMPKRLDDYLDNEVLFAAYPELREMDIDTSEPEKAMFGLFGSYTPSDNAIKLNDMSHDTLIHEVQHAIQHIEGFEIGGNKKGISDLYKTAKKEWQARKFAENLSEKRKELGDEVSQQKVYDALVEEYKEAGLAIPSESVCEKGFNYFVRGYADESLEHIIKAFDLDNNPGANFDAHKAYKNLSGEATARNVQKRLGMSEEERRASLAAETEDVSREDQIFLKEGLGLSAASDEDVNLDEVNERFNEELDRWENGVLPASSHLSLGKPMGVMRTFMPDTVPY